MKNYFLVFFLVLAFAAAVFFQGQCASPIAAEKPVSYFTEEVFFCPADNCSEKLVSKINSAEKTVHVAIYSFTHDEIALSLIDAKNRGIEVLVLMEKQQSGGEYSDDEKLQAAGIEVKFMDNPSGIMHNKFAVIDSKLVGTGSFNYTANADEHNNENLVFLDNPETVQKFEEEFQRLWKK